MAVSGPTERKESQAKIERFKKTLDLALENLLKEQVLLPEDERGIRDTINGNLLVTEKELRQIFSFATAEEQTEKLLKLPPEITLRVKSKKPAEGGLPLPRTIQIKNHQGNFRLIIDTKGKYVEKGVLKKFPKGTIEKGGGFKKGKPMSWVDENGKIRRGFNLVMRPEKAEDIAKAKEEARISQELPPDTTVQIFAGTLYDENEALLTILEKENKDSKASKAAELEAEKPAGAALDDLDLPDDISFDDQVEKPESAIEAAVDESEAAATLDDLPDADKFSFGEPEAESPEPASELAADESEAAATLGDLDLPDNISFDDEPEKPAEAPAQVEPKPEKPQGKFNVLCFEIGVDLQEYLTQNNPDPSQRQQIIKQVFESINGLHKKDMNYVHQDIKPQNFLVFTSPEGIQVKVTDFGTTQKEDIEWPDAKPPSSLPILSPEMAKDLAGIHQLQKSTAFSELLYDESTEPIKLSASKNHDMWAVGLTILQILHPELVMEAINVKEEKPISKELAAKITAAFGIKFEDGPITKEKATEIRTACIKQVSKFINSLDKDKDPLLFGLLRSSPRIKIDEAMRLHEEMGKSADADVKQRASLAASAASPAHVPEAAPASPVAAPASRRDPLPSSPRQASPPPSPKGTYIGPIIAQYEALAQRQREMEESAKKRQKAKGRESFKPDDDKSNKPKGI